MSRHASLPGAAELFRPTSMPPPHVLPTRPGPTHAVPNPPGPTAVPNPPGPHPVPLNGAPSHAAPSTPRTGTGRQKHDAKITVYVSAEELVALEQARLLLRAQHGLPVDRGRIVREAIAVILADLDEHGEDSILVRRLTGG